MDAEAVKVGTDPVRDEAFDRLVEAIATPERYRAWVEQERRAGTPSVGQSCRGGQCPVATWLTVLLFGYRPDDSLRQPYARSTGVMVTRHGIWRFGEGAYNDRLLRLRYSDGDESPEVRSPKWVADYVGLVDMNIAWDVSPDDALRLLEEVDRAV